MSRLARNPIGDRSPANPGNRQSGNEAVRSKRDALIDSWDPTLTPKEKRRRIEGLLKLGFRLATELSMDAPAHKAVGSSLGRYQATTRWPRSLSNSHANLSSDLYMLLRHVDSELAQSIVAYRMQVEAGATRPAMAWIDIACAHGISVGQVQTLYAKALDEIAVALDGLAGGGRIGS